MKRIAIPLFAVVLLAGCGGYGTTGAGEPSTGMTSKPAEPDKPVTAGKMAEVGRTTPKATPEPAPVRPIDKTPIVADLSKIAFTSTAPAELFGWDEGESRGFYYANGTGEVKVKVPADGDYEVVVNASCQAALNENAKFVLSVDGQPAGAETVLTAEDPKEYRFVAPLKAGERKIGVRFTNDAYKENEYDRNLYLHGIKLVRVK